MTTPLNAYREKVAQGQISEDPVQLEVMLALEHLYQQFLKAHAGAGRGWRTLKRNIGMNVAPIKGLYIWGDVGRGKTFLVDLFYDCLPSTRKMRLHFHRFMNRVHRDLQALQNQPDPLQLVAAQFAREAKLICFDEFFVSDITDAMLLGRLLKFLFEEGVTLVTTSNIPPQELYKDGLQRAQFLPAIALIEQHLETIHIDSEIDYRFRTLTQVELFHAPADEQAKQLLASAFTQLAPHASTAGQSMEVLGRMIPTINAADDVVWFDFAAICGGPRSQRDYIEVAQCYHTVLIHNVPVFTEKLEEEARRFIALVDEFYDRKVKLLLTLQKPLVEIYAGNKLAFEFQRTLSRLAEMESKEYLALPHMP